MLKDAEGNFICIGGGIKESDGEIKITGHAKFESTDDGKRIDFTIETRVSITGTASVVHGRTGTAMVIWICWLAILVVTFI